MKVPLCADPPGPVQLPPASGFPFNSPISGKEASLLHTVIEALLPATGAMFTFTVVYAVSFAHGAVPETMYEYVPGGVVPGVKVPLTVALLAFFQIPLPSGFPPSTLINWKGPFVLHTVIVPSVPARGAITHVTCTVEEAEGHGAVPGTV